MARVTTAAEPVVQPANADELVRDARAWNDAERLEQRARLAFLVSGGAVAAAALACALTLPADLGNSAWKAVLFLLVYAFAARAGGDFEIGSGSAVATEIVLVPMLFTLPLGLVPIVVVVAFILGTVATRPSALRDPSRVLPLVASAAHCLGPVLVLHFGGGLPLRWSAWPIYVGALGAQFAFDFGAATIGNLGHGIRPLTAARFAAYAYGVDTALAPLGLALAFATRSRAYVIVLVVPLIGLLQVFARERRRRLDHAIELGDAYRGTTYLLGDVIDADDAYTGSHSRHVVRLVLGVCDALGLSPAARRDAEFAALLHDVGKIRIPDAILNKPAALTDEERAIVETHCVEGERMLTQVGGILGQVGHIVRSCHERWDGLGYPDRLAGDAIPLVARIVCACDAYSAMTTDRPYRSALAEKDALAELARCSGTQFDPQVVGALIEVVGSRVHLG